MAGRASGRDLDSRGCGLSGCPECPLSKWRVFKLFVCTTYAVSNWNGSGFYWDNQTGTPLSAFYGQFMNTLFSFRPGGGQLAVDWSPVWFIKNC